jgi:UDP-N-acetylglucosamine--N-acetylmuramyl-(pentapeptide) pyrophosphoryl-undecaprenol N-acetylglucosamine transferase
LICAGGTGGGVNPALAVLNALLKEHAGPSQGPLPAVQALWVGAKGGMESGLVERAGISYQSIPASGLHGVGLKALPGNTARLVNGAFASGRILSEFKPDVLFFTGGYVAVPMAIAGWRIPTLLYVPDIEPGLALKTLARFADRIAVTAEDSSRYFQHKERIILTGYPTRPELSQWERKAARKALQLTDEAPVLLIAGGSKGARTINTPVMAHLPDLLAMAQVVHITGELDWEDIQAKARALSPEQARRYHAFPYLYEQMGAALAAADLALSRAGASTLGEYPLFGLPAILVPYPYAWRYQIVNAGYLAQHGAAVIVENQYLPGQLLPTVSDLLKDPAKLTSMRAAMQRLSHPNAATEIGNLILALAEKRSGDRG